MAFCHEHFLYGYSLFFSICHLKTVNLAEIYLGATLAPFWPVQLTLLVFLFAYLRLKHVTNEVAQTSAGEVNGAAVEKVRSFITCPSRLLQP